MLDSFEKESRLQERRAARQRQMQIMEEAVSGIGLDGYKDDDNDNHDGYKDDPLKEYSIEEDEDDVPSMYSDYAGRNSKDLWGSGTTKANLSEDKLKFVLGDSDDNRSSASSWRSGGRRKEHEESHELLMLAGRRVSMTNSSLEIGYSYGENEERKRYHTCGGWIARYKKLIYVLGALLVVGLIVMGVSIGEKEKNANHNGAEWPPKQGPSTSESSGSTDNYNPEQPSTDTPASDEFKDNTNNEMDVTKFNRIKDRILEHQISHASTLEDANSPQYKALTWIVRDDPRQLDVALIDDETIGITGEEIDQEEALFERYALVVLWFATTDKSIVNGKNATSNIKTDISWKKSTDWLSSSGFCQWYGIICHPDIMSSNPMSHFHDDFHVAILNLTDNNIHGEVPRELYMALSKMQSLDLSGNELGGEIGLEIGELKDLQGQFMILY